MQKILVEINDSKIHMKYESGALRVQENGRLIQRVPIKMIESISVSANPAMDSNLLRHCAEAGVPVFFAPTRYARTGAWLGRGISESVAVRVCQHRLANSQSDCLTLARAIIHKKICVSAHIPLTNSLNKQETPTCADIRKRLLVELENAQTLNELRGIEGYYAKIWFAEVACHIPSEWHFSGRNRRPPKDPVNAVLSLSYTMLLSQLSMAVQQRGLDVAVGYLHELRVARESLALYLLEPFRALLDYFVLSLFDEYFERVHFVVNDECCQITKEGRSLFYAAWNHWRMDCLPESFPVELLIFGEQISAPTSPDLRQVINRVVESFASHLFSMDNQLTAAQ